jgi:hypothetical protein
VDGEVKPVCAWIEERAEDGPYYRLCLGPFTCRVDQTFHLEENEDPAGDGRFFVEVTHGEYDELIGTDYSEDMASGKATAVRILRQYIEDLTNQLEALCATAVK